MHRRFPHGDTFTCALIKRKNVYDHFFTVFQAWIGFIRLVTELIVLFTVLEFRNLFLSWVPLEIYFGTNTLNFSCWDILAGVRWPSRFLESSCFSFLWSLFGHKIWTLNCLVDWPDATSWHWTLMAEEWPTHAESIRLFDDTLMSRDRVKYPLQVHWSPLAFIICLRVWFESSSSWLLYNPKLKPHKQVY